MNLRFLPADLQTALKNLNINFLTEIRLRRGQPVIIEYCGEYKYINKCGAASNSRDALVCDNADKILYAAMDGSIYSYSEQLKRGFITVEGGVRIGIAGEYVTDKSGVAAVKNATSLNVRIPHEATGCAAEIFDSIFSKNLYNALIFSPAGYGKTTVLRDLSRQISLKCDINILVYDERWEISGVGAGQIAFNLGARCDVVCGADKRTAFINAVRAMKPSLIITDELYGEEDFRAIREMCECGIKVIASSHLIDRNVLKKLPFTYFIGLSGIGKQAVIYDKNFNTVCNCNTVGNIRADAVK